MVRFIAPAKYTIKLFKPYLLLEMMICNLSILCPVEQSLYKVIEVNKVT